MGGGGGGNIPGAIQNPKGGGGKAGKLMELSLGIEGIGSRLFLFWSADIY